jgi:hypothetical protein
MQLLPIQHRRPRQAEMPEQLHQLRQPLLTVGVEIEAGVIEEAGAGHFVTESCKEITVGGRE